MWKPFVFLVLVLLGHDLAAFQLLFEAEDLGRNIPSTASWEIGVAAGNSTAHCIDDIKFTEVNFTRFSITFCNHFVSFQFEDRPDF